MLGITFPEDPDLSDERIDGFIEMILANLGLSSEERLAQPISTEARPGVHSELC
jgi:hypothetical protein